MKQFPSRLVLATSIGCETQFFDSSLPHRTRWE